MLSIENKRNIMVMHFFMIRDFSICGSRPTDSAVGLTELSVSATVARQHN